MSMRLNSTNAVECRVFQRSICQAIICKPCNCLCSWESLGGRSLCFGHCLLRECGILGFVTQLPLQLVEAQMPFNIFLLEGFRSAWVRCPTFATFWTCWCLLVMYLIISLVGIYKAWFDFIRTPRGVENDLCPVIPSDDEIPEIFNSHFALS